MNIKEQNSGFTIIEFLIVFVIIGMIATLTYPSYADTIRESRRADAQATLLALAGMQQEYFSEHKKYTTDLSSPDGLNRGKNSSIEDFYNISVVVEANGYTITAVPALGSSQNNDEDCYIYTINSSYEKGASTKYGANNIACW